MRSVVGISGRKDGEDVKCQRAYTGRSKHNARCAAPRSPTRCGSYFYRNTEISKYV
jgi:hypothetical protein